MITLGGCVIVHRIIEVKHLAGDVDIIVINGINPVADCSDIVTFMVML